MSEIREKFKAKGFLKPAGIYKKYYSFGRYIIGFRWSKNGLWETLSDKGELTTSYFAINKITGFEYDLNEPTKNTDKLINAVTVFIGKLQITIGKF
jgi:hypothetical protein